MSSNGIRPKPAAQNSSAAPARQLLSVTGLSVYYAGVVLALSDVDLNVRLGECHAVLGANGAGKSTLLKAISGLLASEGGAVTAGSVVYDGRDLAERSAVDRYRDGIVHVLEGRHVLPHLSVHKNLLAGAHRLPRADAAAALSEVYERIPMLDAIRSRPAGQLSGGQQQLVVIGRAMVARPRLLLIDEPSLGLAPKMAEDVFDTLATLHGEQTIVLVEQNVTLAEAVADRTTVLELGCVASRGGEKNEDEPPDLAGFYLGSAAPAVDDPPLRRLPGPAWATHEA